MTVMVMGGTGFIGRRLVPRLAARGEKVTVVDISPHAADFSALGEQVSVVRGDVTQFDTVLGLVLEVRPERLVNLSYHIGSDLPPHVATKLNVVGMDNCFEAARLGGVRHTVYASSLAVSGAQSHFGERATVEDDYRYGDNQYAMNKIFNEWQARDYVEKYGMVITGVRPANVTGPDKIYGSVDHVQCITEPARGRTVSFRYADAMRIPIHVEDIAEVFERVVMADAPRHRVYNSGGHTTSLGDLAALVKRFLPEADIRFERPSGGRERSGNYLIDNTRLIEEFGLQYAPFEQRVLEIINDVREAEDLPPVAAR